MTFDASYIALCRELRLKRETVEPGDFALVCLHHEDGVCVAGPGAWYFSRGGFTSHGGRFREGDVWIPRLDQLLSMLEEAGTSGVLFTEADSRWEAGAVIYRDPWGSELGATREEAAARLWCAVTGRVVTA